MDLLQMSVTINSFRTAPIPKATNNSSKDAFCPLTDRIPTLGISADCAVQLPYCKSYRWSVYITRRRYG